MKPLLGLGGFQLWQSCFKMRHGFVGNPLHSHINKMWKLDKDYLNLISPRLGELR
jgi:hypothetical protein